MCDTFSTNKTIFTHTYMDTHLYFALGVLTWSLRSFLKKGKMTLELHYISVLFTGNLAGKGTVADISHRSAGNYGGQLSEGNTHVQWRLNETHYSN